MARAIVAVIAGILSAFVSILLVQAVGALAAPAGPAPSLKDAEHMREYLSAMPMASYAFLLAAYLVGSALGGTVAGRIMFNPRSRCVWIVGGILLVTTVANIVLIPHPLWFSIASVVMIFMGTGYSTTLRPAVKR